MAPVDRRTFLKAAGGAAAAALVGRGATAAKGELPKRTLGKTGQRLSVIGLGGIVAMGAGQEEANRIVREAYDRGVNYFDVAPSYGNGEAEERLGPALEGLRDTVFLACKTGRRDREGAAAELRTSLRRLRTDHFDLYQLHGLTTMQELDQAMGPNGAMEAFLQARKEGLIRWIGFSAHSAEVALAAMDRYDFDTILFPVNFAAWMTAGFGPQVMARARAKGMGRLALKTTVLGRGNDPNYPKCWYRPLTDPKHIEMALRFTLSQGVTAAIPPGDARLFRMALDAATRVRRITKREERALAELARGVEPIFRLAA